MRKQQRKPRVCGVSWPCGHWGEPSVVIASWTWVGSCPHNITWAFSPLSLLSAWSLGESPDGKRPFKSTAPFLCLQHLLRARGAFTDSKITVVIQQALWIASRRQQYSLQNSPRSSPSLWRNADKCQHVTGSEENKIAIIAVNGILSTSELKIYFMIKQRWTSSCSTDRIAFWGCENKTKHPPT